MGFLAKFVKYAGTSFLQNTTGRPLLAIAVSVVVKGIGKLNHKLQIKGEIKGNWQIKP